jgi:2-dehydro-3-deoxygluconokinase
LEEIVKMKVVTFGEIMLRLAPFGYDRFVQTRAYEAGYGGGEANVAVSLANYGMDACFVTRLPEHEIGQAAINSLRNYGVQTDKIVRGGDRVGIYYLEKGASQRPSKVIYDRNGSSIAKASREEFHWDDIFEGAKWFHFTGITPALGENVAQICEEACKTAKEKGITVSCDLNYRKKLWTKDQARKTMERLCAYVDVCIANEEDAEDVFGIKSAGTDVAAGQVNHDGYKMVTQALADRFGFRSVAITLRESLSASDNLWAAILYDKENYYFSKKYSVHIVDRVGGGDSFGAGLIYAMINGYNSQDTIEFAAAASCLKHSIEGDYNLVSVEEVRTLMKGGGSGRVQR